MSMWLIVGLGPVICWLAVRIQRLESRQHGMIKDHAQCKKQFNESLARSQNLRDKEIWQCQFWYKGTIDTVKEIIARAEK